MTRHTCTALAVAACLLLVGCSGDPADGPAAAPAPAPAPAEGAAAVGAPSVACTETPRTPAASGDTWRHPDQSFYDGTEAEPPTAADLEHLLGADAAVVVHYDPAVLPAASLDALRSWAQLGEAVVALPGVDLGAPVVADVLEHRLSCDGLDTFQLDAFAAERDAGAVDAH
ncbi:DUF3105 domain-containing protein [Nocardioides flavescens]|uniref:DUF3105 domain-containing protein n=1 Tax=Nocardioides flavescens TaxID=2691959 RepID=A0A6L7F1H6_9ACTN|nr:DUF3105 domain-containing protein [Nocardioides flavescens]MXG90302.1 DUF3105 domain-containing protein [Nocardioides flavescens]